MHDDELGPIGYVVAESPGGRFSGKGFEMLLDAVEQGLIRVLDLEFVAKDGNGAVRAVAVGEIDNPAGIDLSEWEGASSGLLDQADLDEAASLIAAGSMAAVLVFENVWAISLAESLGARLVAASGISAADVLEALDATEQG
jgi:hypothetical protein